MPQKLGSLLIFWDYDTQWGADRSRLPGGAKTWGHLEFENTDKLLELHARYSMPACFAVVAAAALPGKRPYHDAAQVRRIHGAGHEIASHSYQHEWLPGLGGGQVLHMLRESKETLEDCIGARVVTFVPPYNRPMDYAAGLSFSLSERREAPRDRTDLRSLCDALGETGYRFCRVAYRSLQVRLLERLLGRRLDRPATLKQIAGITCARLNTPCGFDELAQAVLRKTAEGGGVVVAYGHPHSIHSGNSQDLTHLSRFLAIADSLRRQALLRICRPVDLLLEVEAKAA